MNQAAIHFICGRTDRINFSRFGGDRYIFQLNVDYYFYGKPNLQSNFRVDITNNTPLNLTVGLNHFKPRIHLKNNELS